MDRGLKVAAACCLVVVALILAGCGSSGPKGGGSTSVAQPAAPPKAQVDAMQGRLGKALLTAREAGPGWKIAQARQVAPTELYCNRPLAGGIQPYAQAQTAFKQRFGSAITQDLWAYGGDGAKQVIDDFRTIVDSCPTWTVTPEVGRTVKYSLHPLTFPKLGDETVAGRLRSGNVFASIEVVHSVIVVMIRRANVVDFVTQSANAGLFQPKAQTEKLARTADRLFVNSG